MNYLIRTFGCQMNQHDSQFVAAMLHSVGGTPVEDVDQADVIVINTCSVRETAENKILGLPLSAAWCPKKKTLKLCWKKESILILYWVREACIGCRITWNRENTAKVPLLNLILIAISLKVGIMYAMKIIVPI